MEVVAHKTHYDSQLIELEVVVVIHGGAYKFFVKDPKNSPFKEDKNLLEAHSDLQKRIASMADTYEVTFLMCKTAIKQNKLEKKVIGAITASMEFEN